MTLNKFRTYIVELICINLTIVICLLTLHLMYSTSGILIYAIFFFGACIAGYFLMLTCTIADVTYANDHPFALYVMSEEERQIHFKYVKEHPDRPVELGIYSIIGYKIKES